MTLGSSRPGRAAAEGRQWSRALLLTAWALVAGCREEVVLGAWEPVTVEPGEPEVAAAEPDARLDEPQAEPEQQPDATPDDTEQEPEPDPVTAMPDASVGSGSDSGLPPLPDAGADSGAEFLTCPAPGIPGAFNPRGDILGATDTNTDWTMAAPAQSISWLFTIEQDVPPRANNTGATYGYYWYQQFSLEGGVAARFGLQTEGFYNWADQADYTKIAVFWLSGPPVMGELGDIPYPDARVAATSAVGLNWLTIHARFDWQVCHVYRLSVVLEPGEDEGTQWCSASIEDTTDGGVTLIGRMLLPPGAGLISTSSTSRVSYFEFVSPDTCADAPYVSASFGAPRSGADVGRHLANRFATPARCGTSRFTMLDSAVRHELGILR